MPRREGNFLVEDFFVNTGGLNTADSPFIVEQNQAAGGYNFDYISRGAIKKRGGHSKLNSTANAQLRSLGIGLWNTASDSRKVIRAAGTKIQEFDVNSLAFTNLTEDTAAATSDILPGTSEQPVLFSMFTSATANTLWMAGGGLTNLYGVYSATKVTKNGVPSPTASSFTATSVGAGGSLQAGTYRYTLTYRKASTQAESNAVIEASVTTVATDSVTLAWTLTNVDTTKYDQIRVYRSALSGSTGFTTGDLVSTQAISSTGMTDTGGSVTSSTNVPRAGGTVDNSECPVSTPLALTMYKRRLVTASTNTIYFSDINKPESWPTANSITIPSGGKITGLGVVSFTSVGSNTLDEILVVFKQTEIWIITGSSISDYALKYLDNTGAVGQSLVASANGAIYWCSYRGFYMWNGTGKPIYLSQTIEDRFQQGGDIDKSKFNIGFCVFSQKRNDIEWYLSSNLYGEQKICYKLDLRLTLPGLEESLGSKVLPGIFTNDVLPFSVYSGSCFFTQAGASEESIYLGDGSGFLYSAYASNVDAGSGFDMRYITPYLHMGSPTVAKRIHKVVAWVKDTSAWDLVLDFWSKYRFDDMDSNTITRAISESQTSNAGVWDISLWDIAYWDGSTAKIVPVTFNLGSGNNNNEGDSFRLQFSQEDTGNLGSTVTLYGFSVYYTEVGTHK